MRRLCLSTALLFLLVILVDSTPLNIYHIQDEGRSSLTSPLQFLGNDGSPWKGAGQVWSGYCQAFLDISCHVGQDYCPFLWFWQHWTSSHERIFSSSMVCSLVVVCGLLVGVASLVGEQGL